MTERYKLQVGRWGMYVHDTETGQDIDMEQVRDRLNATSARTVNVGMIDPCHAVTKEQKAALVASVFSKAGIDCYGRPLAQTVTDCVACKNEPEKGFIETDNNGPIVPCWKCNAQTATEKPAEDSLPCVSCGKPADTATPDDADMCWPCFGQFNATEYGNLRKRFEELIQRDYPHADVEEALDPCRPLPTTEETRLMAQRLMAENEILTGALVYYAAETTYEDAFDRILRDHGLKANKALEDIERLQETRAP